ncbi:MAG: 16S rRNA (adenine(1518)-N(6)/adenine(1519)-N(6))-dimethyltransferase RsmA [Patescibacteria group bacterium]|nr:ribosomal RNA small subunit methyltransferase A [Patescibacteria group bacterium]MBU1870891.1 ribosomal RNA small subunit methyltransferase A [Patescibacteria group bacterium]
MDLLQQTKYLCNLYDIKPVRSKGQNFLIKEEIYDDIIKAADLKPDDIVLEVGPGLGFLTTKLAKKVKQVIAIELDDKLAGVLHMGLVSQKIKNVEVINEDILENQKFPKQSIQDAMEQAKIKNQKYKIVANLPFNITSIFLRKFLSDEIKPELMVLMLQKEVAERIIAKPPKMSLLAVSVQLYSQPEIVKIVLADNFWPKPAVDSAVVKLKIKNFQNCTQDKQELKVSIPVDKEKYFFRLVKIGFSSKRKMLKNNLTAGYKIKSNEVENKLKNSNLDIKIRAENLSIADWIKLFGEF